MDREEFNKKLKNELAISVIQGKNTSNLLKLYEELSIEISESKRYLNYNKKLSELSVEEAINACMKHGINFNPKKSNNAVAYMIQIIKSSFANTYLKEYKKKYRMTEEDFNEFINEIIPQQLFHVEPQDIDDESGAKLDEVILVSLIANRPSCLKHKPLQWFIDYFLIYNK